MRNERFDIGCPKPLLGAPTRRLVVGGPLLAALIAGAAGCGAAPETDVLSQAILPICSRPAAGTFPAQSADYNTLARCLDARGPDDNGTDWYRAAVLSNTGAYQWDEAWAMQSFLVSYFITHDTFWLDRLVLHADAALAHRDSAESPPLTDYKQRSIGAWSDWSGRAPAQRYVWAGFTGAMFAPMVRFARVVRLDPALHAAYLGKATTYVAAAYAALTHHEPEWRAPTATTGYYVFEADTPVPGLAGDILPYNMGAFMADLHREMSSYYAASGNAVGAATYANKAKRFARYFRDRWVYQPATDSYLYRYCENCPTNRVEDLGHANFSIRFAYLYYLKTNGGADAVFTPTDMSRLARQLNVVVAANGTVPGNLMDGDTYGTLSRNVSDWSYLGDYNATGAARMLQHLPTAGSTTAFFETASIGYTRFVTP